jgi:hypothetical protein
MTYYDSYKYDKHFICWNQRLALVLGQLTKPENSRDNLVSFLMLMKTL